MNYGYEENFRFMQWVIETKEILEGKKEIPQQINNKRKKDYSFKSIILAVEDLMKKEQGKEWKEEEILEELNNNYRQKVKLRKGDQYEEFDLTILKDSLSQGLTHKKIKVNQGLYSLNNTERTPEKTFSNEKEAETTKFKSIYLAIMDLMKENPKKQWTRTEITDKLNEGYLNRMGKKWFDKFNTTLVKNSITNSSSHTTRIKKHEDGTYSLIINDIETKEHETKILPEIKVEVQSFSNNKVKKILPKVDIVNKQHTLDSWMIRKDQSKEKETKKSPKRLKIEIFEELWQAINDIFLKDTKLLWKDSDILEELNQNYKYKLFSPSSKKKPRIFSIYQVQTELNSHEIFEKLDGKWRLKQGTDQEEDERETVEDSQVKSDDSIEKCEDDAEDEKIVLNDNVSEEEEKIEIIVNDEESKEQENDDVNNDNVYDIEKILAGCKKIFENEPKKWFSFNDFADSYNINFNNQETNESLKEILNLLRLDKIIIEQNSHWKFNSL